MYRQNIFFDIPHPEGRGFAPAHFINTLTENEIGRMKSHRRLL